MTVIQSTAWQAAQAVPPFNNQTQTIKLMKNNYDSQRKTVAKLNSGSGATTSANHDSESEADDREIQRDIRRQVLDEFRDDIRDACKEKLAQERAELEPEIRKEVEDKARQEIDQAVRDRLRERRQAIRPEVQAQVLSENGNAGEELVEDRLQELLNEEEPEIRQEIREEMTDEINDEVQERFVDALEEAKPEIQEQVMAEFANEIKARIEEVKDPQSLVQEHPDVPAALTPGQRLVIEAKIRRSIEDNLEPPPYYSVMEYAVEKLRNRGLEAEDLFDANSGRITPQASKEMRKLVEDDWIFLTNEWFEPIHVLSELLSDRDVFDYLSDKVARESGERELCHAVWVRLRERRIELLPAVQSQVLNEKGIEDKEMVEQRLQELLDDEEPQIRQHILESMKDNIDRDHNP